MSETPNTHTGSATTNPNDALGGDAGDATMFKTPGILPLKGLDPVLVLAGLYNRATPIGMGFISYDPVAMTPAQARALLAGVGETFQTNGVKLDYLKGRPIKCHLWPDRVDVRLYNAEHGDGAAEWVLGVLSETQNPADPRIVKEHIRCMQQEIGNVEQSIDEPTTARTENGVAILTTGMADVADQVRPAVERAKQSIANPETFGASTR